MKKRDIMTLTCLVLIVCGTVILPSSIAQNNRQEVSVESLTTTVNNHKKQIWVDDDFGSHTKGWGVIRFDHIQDGIDAVEPGSAVYVFEGVYTEHLSIDIPLQLVGENKESTIIDGDGSDTVITVTADNVTIKGFTIQHSGPTYLDCGIAIQANRTVITQNIITHNRVGVYITWYDVFYEDIITKNMVTHNEVGIIIDNQYYSRHIISENIISDNTDTGVQMFYSQGNGIWENSITRNNYAGISLYESQYQIIRDNRIIENYQYGIFLETSQKNTFSSNIFIYNGNSGLHLYTLSDENIIVENTFKNNHYGIYIPRYLWDCAINNRIYHNNFINNDVNAFDLGPNIWDNGYPSGGNYWSDHVCNGNPSDGTQPYHVTYNADDRYPFEDINGWT